MQNVSTRLVSNDNDVLALNHRQTSVDIGLGQIRETGVWVRVASNYAARYNFAVGNYKFVDQGMNDRTMRNMRGDRFFLIHIIVMVLFGASVYCIIKMDNHRAIVAISIITSIIYLVITCYNWHIYRTNDNVMHDCMIEVPRSYLPGTTNTFFEIPVHARLQNQELIAASDGRTTAVITQLQQRYHNLAKIKIMLYTRRYKMTYSTFPAMTIFHFLLFLGILVGSIYQLLMSLNLIEFIYKQIHQ